MSAPRGFADPQSVEREQRGQGVVPSRAKAGLDVEGAELVAIQSQGPRLVVDLGAAHVERRVAVDELFLFAVSDERRQGRQPPAHRGPHPSVLFHPTGEQLQVRSTHGEQGERPLPTPRGEQPKIGGVAAAGAPDVTGQEPGDRDSFGSGRRILNDDEFNSVRHGVLLGDPTRRRAGT
jgi:hypothetical protein